MTTPFDLNNEAAYQTWKQNKLAGYPTTLGELLVEIKDPFALTAGEKEAILSRCTKANMAVFRLTDPQGVRENPLPAITSQLGIRDLDLNLGAGEEGLSALTPGGSAFAPFAHYIPYRAAAIGWHTDGYYNPFHKPVQSLCLYCERPAHTGGENALWDHEMVYISLRDQNPEIIRDLMVTDVMTIPARLDAAGLVARPERPGPVFLVTEAGHLHMRFTNRTKSIRWRADEATRRAVAAIRDVLSRPAAGFFQGRLEAGWGLISNNLLHTREAFQDLPDGAVRLLYRARFFDRLPTV